MKHSTPGAWLRRHRNILPFLFAALLLAGCTKENSSDPQTAEIANKANLSVPSTYGGFGNYTGLDPQTVWELQQAKIATARYNYVENAIADGYVDANIVVPEMGHHYLKAANLDGTFDYAHPELLVYNKQENGNLKLVALEYAMPIGLSPNGPPSGFTGDDDVWGTYQGALWTLHAWIWEYNPNGVFNPLNPNVDVH